ncbi:hypothetical protein B0T26DRAFT_713777, partial [Lasiosphaeria miniovina]
MAERADFPDDDDPFYLTPDLPAREPPAPPARPVTALPPDHNLLNHKYESIDILMLELQAWANEQGFSVKKERACNYIKDFEPSRVDISCLWDKLRPSEAHSRKIDTMKRDCCFKAVATALAVNNRLPHLEV